MGARRDTIFRPAILCKLLVIVGRRRKHAFIGTSHRHYHLRTCLEKQVPKICSCFSAFFGHSNMKFGRKFLYNMLWKKEHPWKLAYNRRLFATDWLHRYHAMMSYWHSKSCISSHLKTGLTIPNVTCIAHFHFSVIYLTETICGAVFWVNYLPASPNHGGHEHQSHFPHRSIFPTGNSYNTSLQLQKLC